MKCEECQTVMVKIYGVKEVEEEFPNAPRAQFNLLRQMTCPKCGFSKELSLREIVTEFANRRKDQGKSDADIVEEVKDKVEDFKKGGA